MGSVKDASFLQKDHVNTSLIYFKYSGFSKTGPDIICLNLMHEVNIYENAESLQNLAFL